jgi:hypothetical protein
VIREGVTVVQLSDGAFFGEATLYEENAKRRASVITHTYCQLFLLSRNAVVAAFAAHADAFQELMLRVSQQVASYAERTSGTSDASSDGMQGLPTSSTVTQITQSLRHRHSGYGFAHSQEGCASASLRRWFLQSPIVATLSVVHSNHDIIWG